MLTLKALSLLVLTGKPVNVEDINSHFSRRLLPYIIRSNRVDLAKRIKISPRTDDVKEAIRLGNEEMTIILYDKMEDKSLTSIRKIIQLSIICNNLTLLHHMKEFYEEIIIISFILNRREISNNFLQLVNSLDERTIDLIGDQLARSKKINNRIDDYLYSLAYSRNNFVFSLIKAPNCLIRSFSSLPKLTQEEVIYTLINFSHFDILESLINKIDREFIFKYRLEKLIDKVPVNSSSIELAVKYNFRDRVKHYLRKTKPSCEALRLMIENMDIDLLRECLKVYPGYICGIFAMMSSVNELFREEIINNGLLSPIINSIEDFNRAKNLTNDRIKQIILEKNPSYSQLMEVINSDINISSMSKLLDHPLPFRRGKLAEILTWAVLSYHSVYYIIEPEVEIDGNICTPDIYIPREDLYLEVKSGNIHKSYVNYSYRKLKVIIILAGLAAKQKIGNVNALKIGQLLELGI